MAEDNAGAIGLTPGFEKGKCSVCGAECEVRILLGTDRIVKICRECAAKSALSVDELLEKHGAKAESG